MTKTVAEYAGEIREAEGRIDMTQAMQDADGGRIWPWRLEEVIKEIETRGEGESQSHITKHGAERLRKLIEDAHQNSKDMRLDAHIRRLTVAVSARIDNEEIRQLLAVLSEAGDRTIAGPRADTAEAMEEWSGVVNPQVERFDELQRLIGEQLRSTY